MKNLLFGLLSLIVLSSGCKKKEDLVPVSFTVSSIVVNSFPERNSQGQNWDSPNLPDIGLWVTHFNTFETAIKNDCNDQFSHNFECGFTFPYIPEAGFQVTLIEYDNGVVSEDMVFHYTILSEHVGKSTFTITTDGYSVTVFGTWNY